MPAVLADALAEQGHRRTLHHEALAIRADHGLRLGFVESLEALAAGRARASQDARLLAAAARGAAPSSGSRPCAPPATA